MHFKAAQAISLESNICGQGLCDSLFESSDHTDSRNIEVKSRQPRDGTLEHLKFSHENDEYRSIARILVWR